MRNNKIIYIIIIALILGFIIYKQFIEVPGYVAGERAIEELIAQVYYEDVEKYLNNIFIKNENQLNHVSLPEFTNINEASEEWIWMVLYTNLESEENTYTYEQINEELVTLFSENLNKKFPQNGIEGLIAKNEETGMYYKLDIEKGLKNYRYCIKTQSQEEKIYKINIIEYTFLNNEENFTYTLIDKEGNELNKYNYEGKTEEEKCKIKLQIEKEISENQYNLTEKEIVIKVEEIGKPNVVSITLK